MLPNRRRPVKRRTARVRTTIPPPPRDRVPLAALRDPALGCASGPLRVACVLKVSTSAATPPRQGATRANAIASPAPRRAPHGGISGESSRGTPFANAIARQWRQDGGLRRRV